MGSIVIKLVGLGGFRPLTVERGLLLERESITLFRHLTVGLTRLLNLEGKARGGEILDREEPL